MGKPVPAHRSALFGCLSRQELRHAGVVSKNHTHLRQGFGGSYAGGRNPPKHDRSVIGSVPIQSYAFLQGKCRALLRRRMKNFPNFHHGEEWEDKTQ